MIQGEEYKQRLQKAETRYAASGSDNVTLASSTTCRIRDRNTYELDYTYVYTEYISLYCPHFVAARWASKTDFWAFPHSDRHTNLS